MFILKYVPEMTKSDKFLKKRKIMTDYFHEKKKNKKINSTTLIESRTYKRIEDFTYKEHNVILLCIPFE